MPTSLDVAIAPALNKNYQRSDTGSLDQLADTAQTVKHLIVSAPPVNSDIITQVNAPSQITAQYAVDKYEKYKKRLSKLPLLSSATPIVELAAAVPLQVTDSKPAMSAEPAANIQKQSRQPNQHSLLASMLFCCLMPSGRQAQSKVHVQEQPNQNQNIKATSSDDAQDEKLDKEVKEEEISAPLVPPLQTNVSDASLPTPLLPPSADPKKMCLVVDLDETLVHSSFKPILNPDFVIPVDIEGVVHQVYVLKRPHCDKFLQIVGELFEVVIFTASLRKYADPVIDQLDPPYQAVLGDNAEEIAEKQKLQQKKLTVSHRLFRESCINHRGIYVKDLSLLGRDLTQTLILDNSPASYSFHPTNALPVTTWISDKEDVELLQLAETLQEFANRRVADVRDIITDLA